jgi:hypothetical protein
MSENMMMIGGHMTHIPSKPAESAPKPCSECGGRGWITNPQDGEREQCALCGPKATYIAHAPREDGRKELYAKADENAHGWSRWSPNEAYKTGFEAGVDASYAQLAAERERAEETCNNAEIILRRLNAAQEEAIILDAKCRLYEARAEKAEGEAKALRSHLQACINQMEQCERLFDDDKEFLEVLHDAQEAVTDLRKPTNEDKEIAEDEGQRG